MYFMYKEILKFQIQYDISLVYFKAVLKDKNWNNYSLLWNECRSLRERNERKSQFQECDRVLNTGADERK